MSRKSVNRADYIERRAWLGARGDDDGAVCVRVANAQVRVEVSDLYDGKGLSETLTRYFSCSHPLADSHCHTRAYMHASTACRVAWNGNEDCDVTHLQRVVGWGQRAVRETQ